MANKKSEEKKLAFELFMCTSLSQKQIADNVGVAEKTLSSWANNEEWDKLKMAKYSTDHEILLGLQELLKLQVLDNIEKKKAGTFTKNDADCLVEITKTIDTLQNGISLRIYVQVLEEFMNAIPVKQTALRTSLAEFQMTFLTSKNKRG
jgi:transposase